MTFDPAPHMKVILAGLRSNRFGPKEMKARAALLAQGWTDDDIERAVAQAEAKKSAPVEVAYGGYVFLVPGAMMTPALLAYSLEHDENYLEELLALALEGAAGFSVTYKPGDAMRRTEPHTNF